MDTIALLKLQDKEIDNCVYKNQFVVHAEEKYVAFAYENMLSEEMLRDCLRREELLSYGDVIVFCGGEIQNPIQVQSEDILGCFWIQICGLVFRRELLRQTGIYNEKLHGMTDFELLCRLTDAAGSCLLVFPGITENALVVSKEELFTYAYLLRKYMYRLQKQNKLEELLTQMFQVAEMAGLKESFQEAVNSMFDEKENYRKIAAMTAPFLVFRGDDTCHGVLKDFAEELAKGLWSRGQAVVFFGNSRNEIGDSQIYKGIVGFQAVALTKEFVKSMPGPKLEFWLDNPIFYEEFFQSLPDDCFLLCQDQNYADHIRTRYDKRNAVQFPPAGHAMPWNEDGNRPYDIVFIGGYLPESNAELEGLQKQYYDYMLEYPEKTFSQGLQEIIKQQNKQPGTEEFMGILRSLKPVCQRVINHFRTKVINTILQAGYEVHVYGDSWKQFSSPFDSRLIIHPEVNVEESLQEWKKAKIGLNIMSWHKAGMTERVANIMLAGAVCLTDETDYIKHHFTENQIICFQLNKLEELPVKIADLLEKDCWRGVARQGYQVAMHEHTWERRAEQLVALAENIWQKK